MPAMQKLQAIHRTAEGIWTQYNRVHGIPEGGQIEAENVDIRRNGVLSKIRGRNRYGLAAASQIAQLFEFKDRIFRHHGTTIDYDSDGAGTWTAFSGSFSAPATNHRIRAFEQILSLYFTSAAGIYKKATLADEPVIAGIPEGLDVLASLTGTGGGVLVHDAQHAYRVIFGRVDANEKTLLGAPTWREVVTNIITAVTWSRTTTTVTITQTAHGYSNSDSIVVSDTSGTPGLPNGTYTISNVAADTYDVTVPDAGDASGTASVGKDQNGSVDFTIPDDIVAGDFYRVYRTVASASQSTPPGDEMRLVEEVAIEASDITAGSITYTDTTDENFLGESLYTNASEEGITNSNWRPPFAKDLALWKGHGWYLNTRDEHVLKLRFLETTGLVDGTSTVTITDGTTPRTYTFETAEDFSMQEFQRYTGLDTEAQNVEETMKSLCRAINRDTGNSIFYARYVSKETDNPGIIEIRRRDFADTSLSVTCDASGTGDNFSPTLPTSGTTVATMQFTGGNRVMHSKFEQPEAVPRESIDPVGSEFYEAQRAMPLRDSLVILTQKGVYRVSGESDGLAGDTFSISELDPSIQVVAPDCAVILNNAVYCLSTQGVVRVDESGTELVSHQIEDDLRELFGFSSYESRVFAIAYESDRKYILWRPEVSSDSNAQIAHVYDYLTNTWCTRRKDLSAAHVLFNSQLIYEAHATDEFVLQERKSFSATGDDYRDEDIDVTVTAVSTTTLADGTEVSVVTLTYSYTGVEMAEGFSFQQNSEFGIVTAVVDNGSSSYTLTLDTLLNPSVAAATVSIPITSRIRWRPEAAGNASVNKQFPEVCLFMEANNALEHRVAFSSNVIAEENFVDSIDVIPGYGWGEGEWGPPGWGDEGEPPTTPVRVIVPFEYQRCQLLTLVYEHRRAREFFDLVEVAYTFRPYGQRNVQTPR